MNALEIKLIWSEWNALQVHVGPTIIILAEIVFFFFTFMLVVSVYIFFHVRTKRCSSVFTCRIWLLSQLNISFGEAKRLPRLSFLRCSFLCKCLVIGKLMVNMNGSWWEIRRVLSCVLWINLNHLSTPTLWCVWMRTVSVK